MHLILGALDALAAPRVMLVARAVGVTLIVLNCGATAVAIRNEHQGRLIACEKGNDTRTALRKIIQRGDGNLKKFYAEGTITKAQFDRSMRASLASRALLSDVKCR